MYAKESLRLFRTHQSINVFDILPMQLLHLESSACGSRDDRQLLPTISLA